MQHMIVIIVLLVRDIVEAVKIFPNVHQLLEYFKNVRKGLLQRQLKADGRVPLALVGFGADLRLLLL